MSHAKSVAVCHGPNQGAAASGLTKHDPSVLNQVLEEHFDVVDFEVGGSQIVKASGKLTLRDRLRTMAENQNDLDWLEEEDVFSDSNVEEKYLLSFEYRSVGPMSFLHGLHSCDFGGQYIFIFESVDGQGTTAIAGIAKRKYRTLLAHFLKRYYSSNGLGYSDHEMFWSLPSETGVHDKNITVKLQKECYRLFLDTIVERYPDHPSWFGEQEEMMSIFSEPNVIRRSAGLLAKLPDLTSITQYLADQDLERVDGLARIGKKARDNILTLLIYYKTRFMLPQG